jgi:hypothetical protein
VRNGGAGFPASTILLIEEKVMELMTIFYAEGYEKTTTETKEDIEKELRTMN